MMDELWMRGWTADHRRFSADLDRGFARLGAALRRALARRRRPEQAPIAVDLESARPQASGACAAQAGGA